MKHYQRWSKHGSPNVVANWRGRPLADRFWDSVTTAGPDECWEWTRTRNNGGYGQIMSSGKLRKAHRVSYELHFGPIPDGLHVRHRCDNPPCVNPAHLELGTNADNVADKVARGRLPEPLRGQRNPSVKLTDDDVRAIRSDARTSPPIAADFGITPTQVRRIKAGLVWRHIA